MFVFYVEFHEFSEYAFNTKLKEKFMARVLNESEFKTEIIDEKATAVVDFFAPWCGPCRMMVPIIDKLAEQYSDIKIVKVNVDEAPKVAEIYKISVIPSILFFKNGEAVYSNVGVISEIELTNLINNKLKA